MPYRVRLPGVNEMYVCMYVLTRRSSRPFQTATINCCWAWAKYSKVILNLSSLNPLSDKQSFLLSHFRIPGIAPISAPTLPRLLNKQPVLKQPVLLSYFCITQTGSYFGTIHFNKQPLLQPHFHILRKGSIGAIFIVFLVTSSDPVIKFLQSHFRGSRPLLLRMSLQVRTSPTDLLKEESAHQQAHQGGHNQNIKFQHM